MPVMYDAQVFPRFFTTNKDLGLAFLPKGDRSSLDCSLGDCFYILCWDANRLPLAIVTRMPRFVPVPVKAPSSTLLF